MGRSDTILFILRPTEILLFGRVEALRCTFHKNVPVGFFCTSAHLCGKCKGDDAGCVQPFAAAAPVQGATKALRKEEFPARKKKTELLVWTKKCKALSKIFLTVLTFIQHGLRKPSVYVRGTGEGGGGGKTGLAPHVVRYLPLEAPPPPPPPLNLTED